MVRRYLSFDFDGCLFNSLYLNAYRDKQESKVQDEIPLVIQHNKVLLDPLRNERSTYINYTVFVGSNRQSYRADKYNCKRNQTESCFNSINQVSTYLQANLNTFLMPDIYSNEDNGTSFKKIIEEYPSEAHSDWLFDESKFTLLYAQMQLAAREANGEDFVFDFFDDCEKILGRLAEFFNKHPYLIPHGCMLRLNLYNGRDCQQKCVIAGIGSRDDKFAETIRSIKSMLELKEGGQFDLKRKIINVLDYATRVNMSISDSKDRTQEFLNALRNTTATSLAKRFVAKKLGSAIFAGQNDSLMELLKLYCEPSIFSWRHHRDAVAEFVNFNPKHPTVSDIDYLNRLKAHLKHENIDSYGTLGSIFRYVEIKNNTAMNCNSLQKRWALLLDKLKLTAADFTHLNANEWARKLLEAYAFPRTLFESRHYKKDIANIIGNKTAWKYYEDVGRYMGTTSNINPEGTLAQLFWMLTDLANMEAQNIEPGSFIANTLEQQLQTLVG